MVKDYTVLTSQNQYTLTQAVKAAIAQGWQPLGGVSVCVDPKGVYSFIQAMIK